MTDNMNHPVLSWWGLALPEQIGGVLFCHGNALFDSGMDKDKLFVAPPEQRGIEELDMVSGNASFALLFITVQCGVSTAEKKGFQVGRW